MKPHTYDQEKEEGGRKTKKIQRGIALPLSPVLHDAHWLGLKYVGRSLKSCLGLLHFGDIRVDTNNTQTNGQTDSLYTFETQQNALFTLVRQSQRFWFF